MSSEWIDVTVPLENGMVHWEGDPEVKIYRHFKLGVDGMPCNLTKLEISAHTATHMDAMCHFVPGGAGMDEMPLEATMGPCRVIGMDVENQIMPSDLEGLNLQQGERIIFRTRNTTRSWEMAPAFDKDFVSISEAAGKVLAEAGVMTVGVVMPGNTEGVQLREHSTPGTHSPPAQNRHVACVNAHSTDAV